MIPGAPPRPARELYEECRSREKQISRSPQEIPADGPAVEFETAGQGEVAVNKQIDRLATGPTASSILPIFASDFDRPGSTRFSGAPHRRQGGGVGIVNAGRVTEAALTISDLSFGVQHAAITSLRNIEDDVVRVLRIAGDPADRTQVVEHQGVANPPGDHVIGAGGVAADADTAYFCTACRVEA